MKSLLILAVLFVAAQAEVLHVSRTFPEIEGAPQYPAPKIINGIQASRGQLPYQVALYLNGQSFCGGSLISTRWVLTAAHCASGITSFTVHLGAQAISNTNEAGRVIITTTSKVVHASYSSATLANDIALVNLGRDVALSTYIQTIGLASGSATYVGNSARVSGWGRVSDASSSISPQLNYVDVSVISNTQCAQTFGNIIRSSTICTLGSGGRATCNGDSGGPLVDRNSNVQIGVVSFGSSAGCQSGAPNGFARVTEFRNWIKTNSGV